MADKRIQDLPSASGVGMSDLLVLEQSGAAKSVSGQVLVNDLATALDGHGGISSITYAAPVPPSLAGTLTITMADGDETVLQVTNGNGITGISSSGTGLTKTYTLSFDDGSSYSFQVSDGVGISNVTSARSGDTVTYTLHYSDGTDYSFDVSDGVGIDSVSASKSGLVTTVLIALTDGTDFSFPVSDGVGIDDITWETSGVPGDGMLHTGTISYNDGTDSTIVIQDGYKGDTGDQTYVWFKWSATYPTSDGDISDSVNAYIGIYAGTSATAPTHYTDYVWYQYKGDTGDPGETGDYIEPVLSYGTSTAAATEPGTWYNSPSSISYAAGNFIWRKTEYVLHDAQTVQATAKEIIGYIGQNGAGSGTVTQITFNDEVFPDDGTGNVEMTVDASDVGAIADPTTKSNGQVLTYDSSAGEWVAANPTTGNVNTVNNVGVDVGTTNITIYGTDIKVSSSDNTSVTAAIPQASTTTPAALGTAAVGTGTTWARADHVHKKPTASELNVVDIMCGTELTTGENLNNLGFGVYYAQTSTIAASLVNTPITTTGFRLECKQIISSSERKTQIVYTNETSPKVFIRTQTSGGWNAWKMVAGTVSDSPTMEQGMGTLSTGSIRRSGNVVHLNMYVTGTTIGTSAATLATIPSEYCPPSSVYGVAVIGVGPEVAFVEVTTTGNVRIRGGSAQSNVNVRLGITWINT